VSALWTFGPVLASTRVATVSLMDLDQGSEMIIFESILTDFEASTIFSSSRVSGKSWLDLKVESP
jgi:hypothetical protein